MTTGRINQVATNQFGVPRGECSTAAARCSQMCVWNNLRPRMSFAIVLYHWSAPAPAPRPANIRKIGRRRKNGRCCVGVFARFNLYSEHRQATPLEHEFIREDDERTITDPYNPTRVRVAPWNEAAPGVKAKKRNANPKVCESKNLPVSLGRSHKAATREVTKQRGELFLVFQIHKLRIQKQECFQTILNCIIFFFISPLCFMNIVAAATILAGFFVRALLRLAGLTSRLAGVDFLHRHTGRGPRRSPTVIRSYHGESTASHPNCEVKHRWARSVLW